MAYGDGDVDDDSGEYDLKSAEPVRRAARQPPPAPAVSPAPSRPTATSHAAPTSQRSTPTNSRKLLVGFVAAVLVIGAGVYFVAKRTGGRSHDTSEETNSIDASAGWAPPTDAERPASGNWPLPRDVAPAASAKLAALPIDL